MYKNKKILITGGTGSFGRTMTEHLLKKTDLSEIRIFSRDEAKQDQMRNDLSNNRVQFYLGDIRDIESLRNALEGVDFVFHAAALKQVPSCEFFPIQAVKTNILGTENLVNASISSGVRKIVCLSTDKAVYPVNAMGMTKSLMEKIAQSHSRNKVSTLEISCVRYGNVMYSRGSVIPKFINQIKNGKSITITEPSMTRFMMRLPEAVDLVDFAFENAKPGDILIKKSPACSIENLVLALKDMFNSNSKIEIIGMRHGEKLHETLATKEELSNSDDLGDFYRIKMDQRDLNYSKYFESGDKNEVNFVDYDSSNTHQLNIDEIKTLLLKIPEISKEF